MKPYDHKEIEGKWQKSWDDAGIYRADDASTKQKKYVLDMYPYPSGAGLHVGHVEGYTATDIYTRHARMQGYEVLHPMGWDAFGLPAENYAVKTGVPPQTTTQNAIDTFRRQIKALGLSYDWLREVGSHTPEYYQWTQWFFLLLYKNGLAEKKKAKVNWCPSCQTVLANEQVVDGKCERCGTEVVQKDLEQWFFKITEFADALANDLDTIDWPESTKAAQRNWIGRSEGAEIDFTLTEGGETVTVFTTRPDTLFGATYLVLAPEHPLVASLQDRIENAEAVQAYVDATQKKTDLERQETAKEKTGVELVGVKATNPDLRHDSFLDK
jgi:leucyl-tRNA synthetase